MKKLVIIILLASSLNIAAQPTGTELPSVKIDYLKLSRGQKTAAWLMLGGGAVLVTGGMLIALNNLFYDYTLEGNKGDYGTGMIMFYLGGASMLGSIPLFIAGARNKGRSMSASAGIKMEDLGQYQQRSLLTGSYPALTLKFNLK